MGEIPGRSRTLTCRRPMCCDRGRSRRPEVVYAGLNGGGVWKGKWSSDEGTITWASVSVGLTATGAKSIRGVW